ncbi:MAG TPA: hypothetical protein VKP66_15210 [Steroidobacteraceae bacterium]|nr:hypothetical protein [Steroidobacteraceae bacterium]
MLEPDQTVAQSNADGTSMSTQVQNIKEKTVTGRTYKAFWYVPEVKRWVRSVEEYYGNGGVRNERPAKLESFKVDSPSTQVFYFEKGIFEGIGVDDVVLDSRKPGVGLVAVQFGDARRPAGLLEL